MNDDCDMQADGRFNDQHQSLFKNNTQEKEENVFCDRKDDLEHETSVTQAKTTAITDLVKHKEQLFVQRQKRRRSSSSFNRATRQPSFFPRNMSLRIILKGDRI